MKPLPFIMQYVRRYKYRYIAGILTLFAVDAASVFIPKLTGIITDGLTARSITWSSIRTCLLGIFLIGLLLAVGRFLWRYFLFGTARIIERELRNEMFSHLETMDVEYYNSHKTGDLMTRFTSDLNAVRMALGPAVICIFDSVVMTLLVVCQMMYYVNIKLTLLALIPMVIICLGYMHYGKVLDNLYTERQDSVSNLADFVQESFSGIRVIKAFVRKQAEILSFSKKNQDTMDKSMRIAKLEAILIPLLDVIIGFSSLASLLYGGYLALIGQITLGRFVAFNQYVNMLVWPMLACSEAAVMFSQGTALAGISEGPENSQNTANPQNTGTSEDQGTSTDTTDPSNAADKTPQDENANNIQVIYSTLQRGRYPDIKVQTGVPIKWIINAPKGSLNGCNYRMLLRSFGIEHTLSEGENVIEFTPSKSGTFQYTCWMGMIRGNITVTDTLETSPTDPDTSTGAEETDPETEPFFNGSGMGCCGS